MAATAPYIVPDTERNSGAKSQIRGLQRQCSRKPNSACRIGHPAHIRWLPLVSASGGFLDAATWRGRSFCGLATGQAIPAFCHCQDWLLAAFALAVACQEIWLWRAARRQTLEGLEASPGIEPGCKDLQSSA
jgi:hypothetical protein